MITPYALFTIVNVVCLFTTIGLTNLIRRHRNETQRHAHRAETAARGAAAAWVRIDKAHAVDRMREAGFPDAGPVR